MSPFPFSTRCGEFVPRAHGVACLLVLFAPCGVSVSIPKNQKTQHGVKALDGGDADAGDAVELRGLIDSLPRIDPSGFPSVSHRFPLAPLQVLDDLLACELFWGRHESRGQ